MPDTLKSGKISRNVSTVIAYIFLVLGCIVFIYPIYYAIVVAFMTKEGFATTPPALFPKPDPVTYSHYKKLLLIDRTGTSMVNVWYLNTVLRTTWYICLNVLTSLIGGYVFARMKFKGKTLVFTVLLGSAMLPGVITMAPTYLMMAHFPLMGGNNILGQGGTGFLDTYSVLFVLGLVNVMGIFLVRMSMSSSPISLEEAAVVDGAGIFTVIFKVVFPIQQPILAYIAITTGIAIWNDWYVPFIYTNQEGYQTLGSAISKLTAVAVGQYGIPDWPNIIALGLGLTIPCLLLFAFFQQYIVKGLASAAVKG